MIGEYKCITFCDYDGLFNHEKFYEERYKHLHADKNIPIYKVVKKHLRKLLKSKMIDKMDYYLSETDVTKIKLFNEFCSKTNSVVVISASMRCLWTVDELQEIFNIYAHGLTNPENELVLMQDSRATEDYYSIDILLQSEIKFDELSSHLKSTLDSEHHDEVDKLLEAIKEAKADKHETLLVYDC